MDFIKKNNWDKLNKLMRDIRFTHNPNKCKMVLVATQGLVENSNILEERYLLYQSFNQDIGIVILPAQTINDPNIPNKYKIKANDQ
jgi:hypothetical protein